MPSVVDESQIQVSLLHAPGLPNPAVIETHKVRLFAGEPTREYLVRMQLCRDEICKLKKFVLQLIFPAEHIDRGKHAGRCGVADMDDLIRLALAAKLCTVHFETGGIANHAKAAPKRR